MESVCRLYEIGRTKRDDEDDDEEDGEDDDEEDGDEDDDDMVSVPGDNIFTLGRLLKAVLMPTMTSNLTRCLVCEFL